MIKKNNYLLLLSNTKIIYEYLNMKKKSNYTIQIEKST